MSRCLFEQERRDNDAADESYQNLKKLIKENVVDFKNAWKFGDGNGGSIWQMIEEIVDQTPDYIKYPVKSNKKSISNSKKKRVFENDKYRCLKCGTHKDLSIDHIIPECDGGSSKDGNLQTLCLTCNKSKGVKSNAEFMKS